MKVLWGTGHAACAQTGLLCGCTALFAWHIYHVAGCVTVKCCLTTPVCCAAAGLAHGGVPVVFELGKHCAFGNSFAITGEAPGLGAWDPAHAARMEVRGTCRR